MINILRYIASIVIPSVFLTYLGYIVLNGASDRHILGFLSGALLLLIMISWIMPKQQGFWFWLGRVPGFAMVVISGWFYFRLVPPDELHYALVGICAWICICSGAWLISFIGKKWWPGLPVTTGIIVSAGAVLYLLSDVLRDLDWHDVLITNWYVTVLVLYLPLMLVGWFGYQKWRSLKDKEKP